MTLHRFIRAAKWGCTTRKPHRAEIAWELPLLYGRVPLQNSEHNSKNPSCCYGFQDIPINQSDSFSYRTEICQQYLYIPQGPSMENCASSRNKKPPLIQIICKKEELYCFVCLFSGLLFYILWSDIMLLCLYSLYFLPFPKSSRKEAYGTNRELIE